MSDVFTASWNISRAVACKVSVGWTERQRKPLYVPHPRRLLSKCGMPASASRTVQALARRDLDRGGRAAYRVRRVHVAAGSRHAWRKGMLS